MKATVILSTLHADWAEGTTLGRWTGASWQRRRELMGSDHPAIFLHGMWRSGSTYVWSRFRESPGTYCYYEPLHHGLAKLTLDRIGRETPETMAAKGHPVLSAPYFAELAPLLNGRGVRGYRSDLAYSRFSLHPQEQHRRLKAYVAGLVQHARDQGKSAVLGFNRTGLRIAWLKAQFDAVNIYIDREPLAIWASYRSAQAKGNSSFFSMWFRVLEKNASHPALAPLCERLGLNERRYRANGGAQKARHHRLVEAMSDEETYFMVFYLWLICTRHGVAYSDLIIDTRLADIGHYPRRMACEIAYQTGLVVNLDGLRVVQPRVSLPRASQVNIEAAALTMFAPVAQPVAAAPRATLSNVSSRAADLLSAVA